MLRLYVHCLDLEDNKWTSIRSGTSLIAFIVETIRSVDFVCK